jgi:hypothetical protein
VSRKNGSSMTNILAIHSEWLEANGYIHYISSYKAQATRHNPQAKLPKSKAQAQAT